MIEAMCRSIRGLDAPFGGLQVCGCRWRVGWLPGPARRHAAEPALVSLIPQGQADVHLWRWHATVAVWQGCMLHAPLPHP